MPSDVPNNFKKIKIEKNVLRPSENDSKFKKLFSSYKLFAIND
jgi:hypothetical protein